MTGDQTDPEREPQEPATEGSPARPLTIVAVLLAVLLIAGAGTAAAVILTSDGDSDDADEQSATPTPAAVVLQDWCHGMNAFTTSDDQTFDRDPSLAAAALRDVGVPDEMPTEAVRGLGVVIGIADQAEDGEHAELLYGDLADSEQNDVEALFAFYTENCAAELATDEPTTLTPKPSRTPSETPTGSQSPLLEEDQFPTELGTGLPKDWETYLPSDIPTEAESYLDNLVTSSPER